LDCCCWDPGFVVVVGVTVGWVTVLDFFTVAGVGFAPVGSGDFPAVVGDLGDDGVEL
jgi:hypothetical protein